MTAQRNTFENFANGLVPRKTVDPVKLEAAKDWYKRFAGTHAVKMDDEDLVKIYEDLNL
jgi:hypothetical protein